MAQACNSSYLGGEDWEDKRFRPARAKSLGDPILTNGWVKWYCGCHPGYTGEHKQKDHSPNQSGHKTRPYLKNNQCGLEVWLKQ
jgi:hypothetical protein